MPVDLRRLLVEAQGLAAIGDLSPILGPEGEKVLAGYGGTNPSRSIFVVGSRVVGRTYCCTRLPLASALRYRTTPCRRGPDSPTQISFENVNSPKCRSDGAAFPSQSEGETPAISALKEMYASNCTRPVPRKSFA